MSVQCPYCQHPLALKGVKPGRYATNCPKCQGKIHLTIPDDPEQPAVVKAAASGRAAAPPAPTVPETRPPGTPTIGGPAGPADPAPPAPTVAAGEAETVAQSAPAAPASAAMVGPAPASTLGGYRVLQELGRGGMGAVYLARQLSLNRNVALKVMRPEWARNAAFVARFTREAYAAAQLTHHNVVQVYDFGQDRGTTYFSMEYVDGLSLGRLLGQRKRLDPVEAAGYVLQAARGLKFAHDQSMVHRDVKPDNLLLNAQGVVKVADLGLVKTPEVAEAEEKDALQAASGGGPAPTGAPPTAADHAAVAGAAALTLANAAMGTPAFMAPEQARDAARVDQRADIYSLGCTLYDLVTGRPPFEGRTAVEVMTKHLTEPIPPPDTVSPEVPQALSQVILRMTAKRPEERYRDLGEVIRTLEAFLGVAGAGPFTPSEEQANLLAASVEAFNAAPAARVRRLMLPGFLAVCAAMAVLCLVTRKPVAGGAFVGLGLMLALADFVVGGVRGRTDLFLKARQLAALTPLNEWLMVLAGAAVGLVALWVFKLFWVWVALALVAIGIAVVLNLVLDRRVEAERSEAVVAVEGMLRSLRLQGVEEDALRRFVCTFSGDRWEEFYEALFGYDAKLDARRRWGRGDRSRARPRFAPWRDPVAAWLDARVQARRAARERARIERIEERGLVAQGVNEMTARRKARRAAEAMVTLAGEIRQAVNVRDDTIPVNRAIARSLREAALQPEKVLVDREQGLADEGRRFRPADLLDYVIGPKPRFLAGAALLAGCLFWMHQNEMLNAEQARVVAEAARKGAEAVQKGDADALQDVGKAVAARAAAEARAAQRKGARATRRLELPGVPPAAAALLSSFGAGAAGLLLVASSFFRGSRIALFAVPAALVPLLGPQLPFAIPNVDPSLAPAVVGVAIFTAGVLFGRSRR